MTQLMKASNKDIEKVYEHQLSDLGLAIEPRDPVGKIMMEKRHNLLRLAQRASKHDDFIDEHYREACSRLTNNLLDPMEAHGIAYSWDLSYEFYTMFCLRLTCDTIKQVNPVIKILIAEGMRLITCPRKEGNESTKTWEFVPRHLKQDEVEVKLQVFVSAKRCKRVQVGVKEVPQFETVCEWGDDQQDLSNGADPDLPF